MILSLMNQARQDAHESSWTNGYDDRLIDVILHLAMISALHSVFLCLCVFYQVCVFAKLAHAPQSEMIFNVHRFGCRM